MAKRRDSPQYKLLNERLGGAEDWRSTGYSFTGTGFSISRVVSEKKIIKRKDVPEIIINVAKQWVDGIDGPIDVKIPSSKGRCLCTTPIGCNFIIKHKNEEKYAIIGSVCITRFGGHYKRCMKCKEKYSGPYANCRECRAIIYKKEEVERAMMGAEDTIMIQRRADELKKLKLERFKSAMEERIRFGKYAKQSGDPPTYAQIKEKDPKYFRWMIDNVRSSREVNTIRELMS